MTAMADQVADEVAAERTNASGWSRPHRVVGWILLAMWLPLLGAGWMLGVHTATFADLESRVAAGDVHEVEAFGGLSHGGRGYAHVELHWHDGLRSYTTTIVEASSLRAARRQALDQSELLVGENVEARLQSRNPGLVVTRSKYPRLTTAVTHLPWRVPDWVASASLVVWCLTLGQVVFGPPPWRATRWAWSWLLLLAPPVGVTAYLLFGGPSGLARPSGTGRGLTGGWAFVLALIVGSPLSPDA